MFRCYKFLILLLLLFSAACGPAVVDFHHSDEVSSYAARAAWQWQTVDNILVRGRARLEGENQVFSGPFILRASKESQLVRADFCGPDGSPLISFLQDSLGCLIYQPEQADAFYVVGGMPAGSGFLDVNSLVSLLRTGYPAIPEQWKIVMSCDTTSLGENRWIFVSSSSDTAVVSMGQSELYPMLHTDGISLEVTASSWHDRFNAWPMEWKLGSSTINAVLRIRSYNTDAAPGEEVWNLAVPVPVDTVWTEGGLWRAAFDFPIR